MTNEYPFGLRFNERKTLVLIDEFARWRQEYPDRDIKHFDPNGFAITCPEAVDGFAASKDGS